MKKKNRLQALEYHQRQADKILGESIVIKYRINGSLFRRTYTLARATEARNRIQLYKDQGIEVVSVKGLPMPAEMIADLRDSDPAPGVG